eukprot:366441-Chlamydomonas_euryale.AAC.7
MAHVAAAMQTGVPVCMPSCTWSCADRLCAQCTLALHATPRRAHTPATRLIRPLSSDTSTEMTCFSTPSARGTGS